MRSTRHSARNRGLVSTPLARAVGVGTVGEVNGLFVVRASGIEQGYGMSRLHLHPEHHLVTRIGWLRAEVFGANDGIVSTASLIAGVVAS